MQKVIRMTHDVLTVVDFEDEERKKRQGGHPLDLWKLKYPVILYPEQMGREDHQVIVRCWQDMVKEFTTMCTSYGVHEVVLYTSFDERSGSDRRKSGERRKG